MSGTPANHQLDTAEQWLADLRRLRDSGDPFPSWTDVIGRFSTVLESLRAAGVVPETPVVLPPEAADALPAPLSLLDLAFDGFLVTDADGRIVSANPAAYELLGAAPGALVGLPVAEIMSAEGPDPLAARLEWLRSDGASQRSEFSAKAVARDVSLAVNVLRITRDAHGNPTHFGWLLADPSSVSLVQRSLIRTNSALRALSRCNRVTINATDETVLMQEVCRIIVEEGGYLLAWVGRAEADGRILPLAHVGFNEGFLESVTLTWKEDKEHRGPTGTAIRTGQPVLSRDLAMEWAPASWHEGARLPGYHSSLCLPLRDGDRVWGSLSIYAGDPDQFDEQSVGLLSELASELEYGLAALRVRTERDEAEARLRENEQRQQAVTLRDSEDRYRMLFKTMGEGVGHFTVLRDEEGRAVDWRFIAVNPSFMRLIGMPEDPTGRTILEFRPALGEANPELFELYGRVAATGQPETYEMYINGLGKWLRGSAASSRPGEVVVIIEDMTERKQAEVELAASEKRHRGLFTGMLEGVAYCELLRDDEGRPLDWVYLDVNEAFAELTGLEGAVGQKVSELVPGLQEMNPELWEIYGRVATTGQPEEFEDYIEPMAVWLHIVVISPQPGHFVAIFGDVTERKQAEEVLRRDRDELEVLVAERTGQLRESELRYRLLAENTSDWVYWVGPDERFVYVSPSCEALTGYGPGEFLVDPGLLVRLVHKDDRQEFLRHWCDPVAESGEEGLEFRLVRRDGEVRWISHVCSVMRSPEGELLGRRASNVDITDRKLVEEELHTSNELLRRVIDAAPGGIAVTGTEGGVLFWSSGAEELTGWPAQEAVGGLNPMVPESQREQYGSYLDLLGRGDVLQDVELVRQCKDGRLLVVSLSAAPLRNAQGEIAGAVAVFVDVTDRKRAEEELQHTLAALKASNQELEQFANIASHDLQEPLRMVMSYAQLLGDEYGDILPAEAHHYLDYAIEGTDRMHHLVRDLLAYSRVGSAPLDQGTVSSEDALVQALEDLQTSIEETGAQIHWRELPTVRADGAQLTRLWMNLVGNALKFHGTEPPRVQISAERAGAQWRFAVRDNGIGLEPQYAERIFGIFQRLYTREQYPGTGVGLAICKRMVERHGGRIWVDSVLGGGANFYFTLPAGPGE